MPIKDAMYRKFCAQRRNAKARRILFQLTFVEWASIWNSSGQSRQIGKFKGQYVMARRDDIGPYNAENVLITAVEQNHRDQNQKPETRLKQSAKAKIQHKYGILKPPVRVWTEEERIAQAIRSKRRTRDELGRFS